MLRSVVTISLILMSAAVATLAQPTDRFDQGNEFFETRAYDSAIAAYESVLATGYRSAPLYFNLGNAYFKDGDLGHAVLYYLRAQQMAPDDEDIAANLEFARQFTSVQMEGVELNPVSSLFESLVEPYRLTTLAWLSSALFIITFAFLIARYGFVLRGPLVRTGIYVSVILLIASSILTTVKYHHDYLTRRGVIVAEESIVRTGPSELSDKELDAAPGLVVEILSESGDYYNVLFENKRRGWVRKDLVAVV